MKDNSMRLKEIQMKMEELQSNLKTYEAMANAGKVMGKVNNIMSPSEIINKAKVIMQDNEKFEAKNEIIINDNMDDAFVQENEEEDVDGQFDKLFSEIGIE